MRHTAVNSLNVSLFSAFSRYFSKSICREELKSCAESS